MSKTKKILTALLALTGSVTAYLCYSIRIYDTPYIEFSVPDKQNFHPVGEHCYQSTENVSEISQDTLRLLVWNMHKGKDPGWQQALDAFAQNADLLLLQEVTDKQKLAAVFSAQFPTALYSAAFSYLDERSGVSILSKFMPDLYCAAMEKEPWIIIPKVASAVRFPLENNDSLLVVNLHLVNFEMNPTNYRRQIETMMRLIGAHQGPIILAGDFNTWNQGRLQLVSGLAQQAGLKEVSYAQDYRMRFAGNPLDHLFVRGFKVVKATTAQTESSDHNPLLVELQLLKR